MPNLREGMMRRTGKVIIWTFGGIYAIGTWVYGIWYIWQHWGGVSSTGMLAYYGFIRALIWPVWLILGS